MTCTECDKDSGHEIWCSLSREVIAPPAPAGQWIAISAEGRERAFSLAPSASEEFALTYAIRNIHFLAPDRAVKVRRTR